MFRFHGPVVFIDFAVTVAILLLGIIAIAVRLCTGLMVQFIPYSDLRDWQSNRVIDRMIDMKLLVLGRRE